MVSKGKITISKNSVTKKSLDAALGNIFFLKIPKDLLNSAFFAKAPTKKYRYALAKASAFADCQGKFQTLY